MSHSHPAIRGATAAPTGENLADPKDKIGVFNRLGEALDLAKAEALANAALRDGEASNLHEYAEVLKRVKR